MLMEKIGLTSSEFVETPLGIFTRQGNWYYMTSELVEKMVPGFLKTQSMEALIKTAENWVRSTDALTLIVFMLLIQVVSMPFAVVLSLVFMIVWHLSKSAWISGFSSGLIKWLTIDGFVLVLSVISISYLGMNGMYSDMLVALLFFMIFKFGWIRKPFDGFYNKRNPGPTLNDRVIKMLVIRTAMANRLDIPGLKSMEDEMIHLMTRHKNRGKKG